MDIIRTLIYRGILTKQRFLVLVCAITICASVVCYLMSPNSDGYEFILIMSFFYVIPLSTKWHQKEADDYDHVASILRDSKQLDFEKRLEQFSHFFNQGYYLTKIFVKIISKDSLYNEFYADYVAMRDTILNEFESNKTNANILKLYSVVRDAFNKDVIKDNAARAEVQEFFRLMDKQMQINHNALLYDMPQHPSIVDYVESGLPQYDYLSNQTAFKSIMTAYLQRASKEESLHAVLEMNKIKLTREFASAVAIIIVSYLREQKVLLHP